MPVGRSIKKTRQEKTGLGRMKARGLAFLRRLGASGNIVSGPSLSSCPILFIPVVFFFSRMDDRIEQDWTG
jgi:hypothetical protein